MQFQYHMLRSLIVSQRIYQYRIMAPSTALSSIESLLKPNAIKLRIMVLNGIVTQTEVKICLPILGQSYLFPQI